MTEVINDLSISGGDYTVSENKITGTIPFTYEIKGNTLIVEAEGGTFMSGISHMKSGGRSIDCSDGNIRLTGNYKQLIVRGVDLSHLVNPGSTSKASLDTLRPNYNSRYNCVNFMAGNSWKTGPFEIDLSTSAIEIDNTDAFRSLRINDGEDLKPKILATLFPNGEANTGGPKKYTELDCKFLLQEIVCDRGGHVNLDLFALDSTFTVTLSGASTATTHAHPQCEKDFQSVTMNASGASKNKMLNYAKPQITCANMNIHVSGASSTKLAIGCKAITSQASGASKVCIRKQTSLEKLHVSVSGASTATLDGVTVPAKSNLQASGCSKIKGIHSTKTTSGKSVVATADSSSKISGIIGLEVSKKSDQGRQNSARNVSVMNTYGTNIGMSRVHNVECSIQ